MNTAQLQTANEAFRATKAEKDTSGRQERIKAILYVIRTGEIYQPLADKWRSK